MKIFLNELAFLKQKYAEYYAANFIPPSDVSRREFGFGTINKIDYRHKSFSSERELREFMVKEAPLYASYSTAHYEYPANRPMEKKNRLAWDLVFDLDVPSQPLEHLHSDLFCTTCFNLVRGDCLRLVKEFLFQDFGLNEESVSINFSGNKGFHVHVLDAQANSIDQNARKAIVEYFSGPKQDELQQFFSKKLVESDTSSKGVAEIAVGPSEQSRGWGKKFYKKTIELINSSGLLNDRQLYAKGFSKRDVTRLRNELTDALNAVVQGQWSYFERPEKIWGGIVKDAGIAIESDKNVTTDLARLIRLPQSLHGSTSFVAKKIALRDLPSFNPFQHALAFSTTKPLKIRVLQSLELSFLPISMALAAGEHNMQEWLAIFLLSKKKAELA